MKSAADATTPEFSADAPAGGFAETTTSLEAMSENMRGFSMLLTTNARSE